MLEADFGTLRTWLHQRTGVALGPEQSYLGQGRLGPVARQFGYASLRDLMEHLRRGSNRPLADAVIDAMTTHETMFFRDPALFDLLATKVLPDLATRPAVKAWSAACSSGQEVWSFLMLWAERIGPIHRIDMRASDISTESTARVNTARYTAFECSRGLNDARRQRFFRPAGEDWEVREELRHQTRTATFNLVADLYPTVEYDIVLLRNVLYYFDDVGRGRVNAGMRRAIRPGGYLVLGNAERLEQGQMDGFEPLHYGVYRRI